MPLQCEFIGGVQVTHLNLRKVDPNDSATLAADVKMTGHLESSVLPTLLACAATEIRNLWHHDDEGSPRFPMVEKTQLSNVYKDHYLILRGYRFTGVCIKKISYSYALHRCIEATLNATISHPSDAEVTLLTELLMDVAACEIDCDPDLFQTLEEDERRAMGVMAEAPPAERQESLDVSGVYDADPLYITAKAFVLTTGKATASALQKELRISHYRAARLMAALTEEAILSETEGQAKGQAL